MRYFCSIIKPLVLKSYILTTCQEKDRADSNELARLTCCPMSYSALPGLYLQSLRLAHLETVYHLCRSVACGGLCDRGLLRLLPVLILPSLLTGLVCLSNLLPLFLGQRPRSVVLLNLSFASGFDLCDGCRNCHGGNFGGLFSRNHYMTHDILTSHLEVLVLTTVSPAAALVCISDVVVVD